MNERDLPCKATAPAPYSDESFSHEAGEQMSLLPAEFEVVPALPRPGTLAARLLKRLARGERLTHPDFETVTGSWRLSAVVFELALLGWQVESVRINAPTADRPDRPIARYWLAARHVRLMRGEA
jgi:hypothetical protein